MRFEIQRRTRLSYNDFCREYLMANVPVIVTDAMQNWKALSKWSPAFFRNEFGDMKVRFDDHMEGGPGNEGSPAPIEYNMAQFIDRVLDSTTENPAPYFRNRILYDLFPSLRADIEPLPDYLQPNWLADHYLVKRVGDVLNRGAAIEIYIGGTGGCFPVLHYDGSGTHAFLMQIYGCKQYVVFPPEQEPFLYPSTERENISLLNSVEAPDLKRFPLFSEAEPTVFELEPGELLFVPSRWWHTAKMLSPSITISANVLNHSNWDELIRFVARRRANPLVSLTSRVYLTGAGAWRSWRDRDWRTQSRRFGAH